MQCGDTIIKVCRNLAFGVMIHEHDIMCDGLNIIDHIFKIFVVPPRANTSISKEFTSIRHDLKASLIKMTMIPMRPNMGTNNGGLLFPSGAHDQTLSAENF